MIRRTKARLVFFQVLALPKVMPMALRLPRSLAAAAALVLCPLSMSPGDVDPVPPNAHPYGASYAEWTASWWQWYLAQPLVGHPGLDDGLFNVTAGQSGPVWFLSSLLDGTPTAHTRNITVPRGKSVLLAILNYEASNLEDPFPATEGEQRGIANSIADLFEDMTLTVNGGDVDVTQYRFESPQFAFTAPSPWIFGTTGGTGAAVSDGYFVMLKSLKQGHYTLHTTGSVPAFGLTMDMTYEITVN
jgi:hypothetical protein